MYVCILFTVRKAIFHIYFISSRLAIFRLHISYITLYSSLDMAGIILGQNCIWLSHTSLNDLFFFVFFKNLFCQGHCKCDMLWAYGLLKSEVSYYSFL